MSKPIDISVHPSEWEPMKYWSMGAALTREQKNEKLNFLLASNGFIMSEKLDGDLCRIIWDEGAVLAQSRTVSKKTGEYGDLTDKLLFIDDIKNAFSDTTVLLGEVYVPSGTAKETGVILRCLPEKAIARQKDVPIHYYIFDVLMFEGTDLTDAPITERIKYLKQATIQINSPLVSYARYYEANLETFYDKLNSIFSKGGEGVVLYKKTMKPCQGRTSAWETVKVKQELEMEADCFIIGTEPSKSDYTGKELPTWQYWENTKTMEKLNGSYYLDYYGGATLRPITKSYYNGWPGSIKCGVYTREGHIIELCKCSNLTEEFMIELRDNYSAYHHYPVKVDGMALSYNKNDIYPSIRHPRFMGLRDDIDEKDCSLDKILGQ